MHNAPGLWAIDPHQRLWISVRTMLNIVDILWGVGPGAHTCLYQDNSTYEHKLQWCLARASGRSWVRASERADSRCADYCPHSGGSDSHVVIQQWYQSTKFTAGAQPGDNGLQEMAWTCTAKWMRKTPINTKELYFESQDGKTSPCKPVMYSCRRRKVWLQGNKNSWGKKFYYLKT